jgi:hypothetical protein
LSKTIDQLEESYRSSQQHIRDFAAERDAAIKRLASALEINTNTAGLDLLTLIGQALILIDEAKKMVRENL